MTKPKTKKVLTPPTPVDIPNICKELQSLQRQRAVTVKSRNMQANRLQALVAGTIGYHSGLSEKERKTKFNEATKIIKSIKEGTMKEEHPLKSVVQVTLIGIDAFNTLKDTLESEMKSQASKLPISKWVEEKDQRGFGILFLGIVIGECGDISGYANPAKLWRRMACAPWEFDNKTLMGATWRSGKEGKLPSSEWEEYGYSPRRRSISYLIGDGIVKQNEDGPYRKRYDQAKEKAKKNHPKWPDMRCHLHGMLLATKLLLKKLWLEWYGHPPEVKTWQKK